MSYHVQQRQQRQPRFTVQEVGFFTDAKNAAATKAAEAKKKLKAAAEKFLAKKTTNPKPKTKTKPKMFMSEKLFVPPSGC